MKLLLTKRKFFQKKSDAHCNLLGLNSVAQLPYTKQIPDQPFLLILEFKSQIRTISCLRSVKTRVTGIFFLGIGAKIWKGAGDDAQ